MSEVLDLADEQKELQQFKEVEEVQQTLEERLEKLANIDTTIYDLLDSVSNITQSLDKEKQVAFFGEFSPKYFDIKYILIFVKYFSNCLQFL
jgi:hypothetical protein